MAIRFLSGVENRKYLKEIDVGIFESSEAETVMRNLNEGNPMEIIACFARAKENKQEAGSSADNATVAADGPVVKGKGDQAGIDWSRRFVEMSSIGFLFRLRIS